MEKDKPHLTLVDPAFSADHDLEFVPLPFYPWDERPPTLPVDPDEAATAIHLAHGDVVAAANLLRVPLIRLNRLIRHSPRLARVLDEALQTTLAQAASIPIRTLFNPNADQRALEAASKLILNSRLALNHPLSPAPPSTTISSSLTVNQGNKTIQFRWRTDADDPPQEDMHEAKD